MQSDFRRFVFRQRLFDVLGWKDNFSTALAGAFVVAEAEREIFSRSTDDTRRRKALVADGDFDATRSISSGSGYGGFRLAAATGEC